MLRFAQTCEAVAATSKKLEKTALVADYLKSITPAGAAIAAIFLSGRPFAAYKETTLQVGGSLLWRVIGELSGKTEEELTEIYRRHGDGGSVAAEALPPKTAASLSLPAVQQAFDEIAAARGPAAKTHLLRHLLERAAPLEAKYIVKIISGDLRIGLKESLVEEAIARAFDAPLEQVQRANMLLGDIGETLLLAAAGKLADARMRLFHPIDFMLASPVDSPEEALSYFENAAVEDKYDGIRAQAHIRAGEVRLFSRTRDEITESFPELPPALAGLPRDAILDGEIVAWEVAPAPRRISPAELVEEVHTIDGGAGAPARVAPGAARNYAGPDALVRAGERSSPESCSTGVCGADTPVRRAQKSLATSDAVPGRALPFSTLQQRLGRKKVTDKMMRDIPVTYLVFDVLYCDGQLLLDRPLRERSRILDVLLRDATIPPVSETRAAVNESPPQLERDRENRITSQPPAAERRQNAAHGESRGSEMDAELAPEGRKNDRDASSKAFSPTKPAQSLFPFAASDLPPAPVLRAPVAATRSPQDLETLFAAARARGNEGLVIKDLDSLYAPGRRGKSWLKMKRELATLDVVVTAVEYGHGKRIGVLSDYTFAVWDGDRLVNIGKAYSGLTDAEIADMTKWFLAHVTRDEGLRLQVEPKIVLEVAFNNMMRSSRHESGYALRFPRIVRLRPDKRPEDADTVERVREIYER